MNDEIRKFEILKMYLRALTDLANENPNSTKFRIAKILTLELNNEVSDIIHEPTEGF